jgi:hypothetical protein
MSIRIPRGKSDEVIDRIVEALRGYEADHPCAQIDLYRQNVAVHVSRVTSVQRSSSHEVTSRMRRSIRPTRARRPFDASVDPTEARNAICQDRCKSHSDCHPAQPRPA